MPNLVRKTCPECDTPYARVPQSKRLWGCPILRCKQCGAVFIEHDIIEPAFFMYPFAFLPRVRPGHAAAFVSGLVLLIEAVRPAVNQTNWSFYGTSAVLLLWYSLRNTLCDRVDGMRSFKQFSLAIKNSRMRLKNPEYVTLLQKSGYRLPNRLLHR